MGVIRNVAELVTGIRCYDYIMNGARRDIEKGVSDAVVIFKSSGYALVPALILAGLGGYTIRGARTGEWNPQIQIQNFLEEEKAEQLEKAVESYEAK